MKYSIRYIKVTYSRYGGKSIFILRGMYIREWKYTRLNMYRIIHFTTNPDLWEIKSLDNEITFTKLYKD